ncbi:efflux RND transporter periplasmic adaptor subunit [Pontibacter arcticus]|uniref:Efflux transporter periplasmic adaptor subunit n=1 Tax=Pontibacter arcticus TaxID=2080288 RepID=A0A364RF05_9BACT|nr:efflux RND transporter periplasmic adaptor subunit [Pontibacter arcticus]RAU82835.1 efflux transporter periplasmic adaptor subunit [Pontibacter arcticus]
MNNYKIILLAGATFLFSCSEPAMQEADETTAAAPANPELVTLSAQQLQNTGVELGGAQELMMGTTLRLSGEIDVPPAGMVHISVPYGGFVKHTNLLPGSKVRKGQVLAVLEHPDYIQLQQDYLDTKAKLGYAQLEYNRQKELTDEKVSALKNFQQVQSEMQMLRNSQAALRQKLLMININPDRLSSSNISRSIRILSPINGFVQSVNASIGKMVTASDVLFELMNTEDLHLELNAYERDVNLLSPGQKVTYRLANDTRDRAAEITLVGKSVEGAKIIPVHVHLNQKDASLMPGMFVNATVETTQRNVTALPASALVQFEGKTYFYVKTEDGSFRRVSVETGMKNEELVEVKLPDAYRSSKGIVLKGAHNLLAMQANSEEEE